ncbi:hypothetical protein AXF42_Ash001482 [Apostasia shenzhenica]|uniref:Uncharacterized protein n=1 Tax=Apostasia shenzhenica TaxID=1088818 RepID=A0A2I0AV21_9ASPA|nr:hypothetical protein AXF42_Ash001482 [Apostasia shenzhenica]
MPVSISLARPHRSPYKDTFSRPANQGSACPSYHGSPEVVPILKVSIILLLLLVPPTANKRREPRACSPPFLQKTRIKLHHSLPTDTFEQFSWRGRRRSEITDKRPDQGNQRGRPEQLP